MTSRTDNLGKLARLRQRRDSRRATRSDQAHLALVRDVRRTPRATPIVAQIQDAAGLLNRIRQASHAAYKLTSQQVGDDVVLLEEIAREAKVLSARLTFQVATARRREFGEEPGA